MNEFFYWLCFIFMWLMIFGVVLYYIGFIGKKSVQHTLLLGTTTLIFSSLLWLFGGFSISYYGNLAYTIFAVHLPSSTISEMLLQQLFCLYAVIMLIGSVLERGSWRYAAIFAPLWILTIYAPICYLLWGENALFQQAGVLDFSGGLVVHTTAGIGSFVLAQGLVIRNEEKPEPFQYPIAYVGMLFITLGWFAFNMAPAGSFGPEAIRVWLNTLLSILGGGISWFFMANYLEKKFTVTAMMNGMIAGLVGSTCSVGYVTPLVSFLIALIIGMICPLVIVFLQKKAPKMDDAVDSFGMNGVGGIVGSVLTGIFAEKSDFFIQVAGTIFVCIWSFTICWLLHYLLSRFIDPVEEKTKKDNQIRRERTF